MLKKIAIYASLFAISGCDSPTEEDLKEPEVRLYALDCGMVEAHDISVFNPELKSGEERMLADPCFLIVHPKGTLLWDTGISDELLETKTHSEMVNDNFTFHVGAGLENQLNKIGYPPAKIDYVAFSHLHLDHSGNALLFGKSKWLLQEAELTVATGENAEAYGYQPQDYAPVINEAAQTHEGDLDVFGDGRVQLIHTPGHSPGHQMLMIKLKEQGATILSGDLYHFQENYDKKGIPIWNDPAQTKKSFSRLDELMKDNNATLWIQHDLATYDALKLSPAYYK